MNLMFIGFGGDVVCITLIYGSIVFGPVVSFELSRTSQRVVSESGSA
jgi:hypothetical protein